MDQNNQLIRLDHDLLDGYIESLGVTIVNKMFSLYCQQVALYLVDIEKALECDNPELWQEHCHKMKGAAGSVGLKSVHALLVIMEKTSADKTGKAQQLAELSNHHQQALVNFNAWLEKYN